MPILTPLSSRWTVPLNLFMKNRFQKCGAVSSIFDFKCLKGGMVSWNENIFLLQIG
jgi:hypothetical protein